MKRTPLRNETSPVAFTMGAVLDFSHKSLATAKVKASANSGLERNIDAMASPNDLGAL